MTQTQRSRNAWFVLIGLSLLFVAGCGDGRGWYAVNGSVKFKKDGSKAHFGSVEFRSESEPVVIARGKINKDGNFTLSSKGRQGTIGGWHTVVILMPVENLGRNGKHTHGLDAATKYRDHRETDIRVEITADSADELVLEIDHAKK